MSNPESEKTEDATPRRRRKEREKGNVSKSQDLSAAFMVTIGMGLLGAFSAYILFQITSILHYTFTHINPRDINPSNIFALLAPYARAIAYILFPFFAVLFISGIVVVRSQVGPLFATEKIKFKLDNLAPSKIFQNAKKMINPAEPRNLVEFAKSLLKLLIVFFCGFSAVSSRIDQFYGLIGMEINTAFAIIGSILGHMLLNICIAMLILGIIDKKYQDYEYDKSIKMTKQEVKDEYKDIEGDPKIKSRVRSIQMKMARQRMLSNVAKSTVVVTNPTHYAVALEYNKLKNPAPKVVAKGVDFVAFKIREIAQENNVPIVENPPLARTLYKLVPIDGIIPSDMFVAVAEVLAYVYNKDKRGG